MDLSKLPKFSQTGQPPEQPPAGDSPTASPAPQAAPADYCRQCGLPLRTGARFCDACGSPTVHTSAGRAPAGAEAWINVAIGVILLLLFPNLLKYLTHPSTTAFDATDAVTGDVIPYLHSVFFWPDLGVTLFALVMILDGVLLMLSRSRKTAAIMLALTVLAAVVNLGAVVYAFNIIGFQVVCAMAAAFSVYMAMQRWTLFKRG